MLKSFKIIEARAHVLQYGTYIHCMCYLEYTYIECLPTIKSLVRVYTRRKKSRPPPGVIEKQQGDTMKE